MYFFQSALEPNIYAFEIFHFSRFSMVKFKKSKIRNEANLFLENRAYVCEIIPISTIFVKKWKGRRAALVEYQILFRDFYLIIC